IHATIFHPLVSKCPQEDSLRKCLDQHCIKGSVHFRDDFVAYNNDIKFEYNRLVIHFPVAFVHPVDILDIQNTIKCGVNLNFPIVARSGGHSYESYSIGDKDCYLVVDLVNFNKITVDITSQTAIVETGNRLESLHYKMNQHSFAFPAGVCSNIGVGGLILGGGVGFLNRKFGTSSDNILDAQIVLANGTVVNNVKEYPELLWAIRGAGNFGFGIVTALTLRIHPIQKIATFFYFIYDFDQTPLVFSVVNQLGNNLYQNLTLLTRMGFSQPSTYVYGVYLGSVYELQPHIQEFIELSKPKNVSYTEDELYNILMLIDGVDPPKAGFFKVKSFFIDSTGISYEGVRYIMRFVESFKCQLYFNVLLIGGGRVNEIKRKETAFVHRGFLYHIGIKIDVTSETCIQDLEKFSHHFRRRYANFESYQNMNDKQLDNWQCRYYNENFEKLVKIKREYDPYNVFRWNQSIPTNTEISCY
ncbi:22648_t:CDS:2, partial [Cetraspora pellucida]